VPIESGLVRPKCYVADLDAIQEKGLQSELLGTLADPRGIRPRTAGGRRRRRHCGVKDLLDLGMAKVIAGWRASMPGATSRKWSAWRGAIASCSARSSPGRPVYHLDTGPRLERIIARGAGQSACIDRSRRSHRDRPGRRRLGGRTLDRTSDSTTPGQVSRCHSMAEVAYAIGGTWRRCWMRGRQEFWWERRSIEGFQI
jgi:hypothetical protein